MTPLMDAPRSASEKNHINIGTHHLHYPYRGQPILTTCAAPESESETAPRCQGCELRHVALRWARVGHTLPVDPQNPRFPVHRRRSRESGKRTLEHRTRRRISIGSGRRLDREIGSAAADSDAIRYIMCDSGMRARTHISTPAHDGTVYAAKSGGPCW